MPKPIVVLNPNSTRAVTEGMDRALESMRIAGGPSIECDTLHCGPPGVETDADVEAVSEPVCDYLLEREASVSAFVIACFSDPGLDLARARTSTPVFGMAESGYLSALTRGRKLGVISILAGSIPRHARYLERLGLSDHLAGDLPLELSVVELTDEDRAFTRAERVAKELRDAHGADVLLLGCAGMAPIRSRLEQSVGIPVVDPVQAAVTFALGAALVT